jgi:hypothetical protein
MKRPADQCCGSERFLLDSDSNTDSDSKTNILARQFFKERLSLFSYMFQNLLKQTKSFAIEKNMHFVLFLHSLKEADNSTAKCPRVSIRKLHGWHVNFCGNAPHCDVSGTVKIWILCSCEQD